MEGISLNGRGRPYDQEAELSAEYIEEARILADIALARGNYEDQLESQRILTRRHLRRHLGVRAPLNFMAGLIAVADSDGRISRWEREADGAVRISVKIAAELKN